MGYEDFFVFILGVAAIVNSELKTQGRKLAEKPDD